MAPRARSLGSSHFPEAPGRVGVSTNRVIRHLRFPKGAIAFDGGYEMQPRNFFRVE